MTDLKSNHSKHSSANNSTINTLQLTTTLLDISKFQPFIDDINSKNQNFCEMLSTSVKNSISPEDTNHYIPQNILNIQTSFPSVPPVINSELFDKFDDSTLMFICFYQNNPQTRYTAGKILTKRGWMYSRKYSTWFEPQKPLRNSTNEIMEGKFKYWDFEKDWSTFVKKDFKFELKHWEKFDSNNSA